MHNLTECLASLNIFRIQVHTPYPVGPVNTYLIKKKPYTLIDSGPDTEEARESLLTGLQKVGVQLEQIERIVLTHCHSDHTGLAKWLNETGGAEIFVHNREVRKLRPDYDEYMESLPFLQEAGLSPQEQDEIVADEDPAPKSVLPEQGVTQLLGGEIWEYDDMKINIINVPGHSSGCIALYDENSQIFFAGDFILRDITPNPVMEAKEPGSLERLQVLSQYMHSVESFARLPVKIVLPGHGSFIKGNTEITGALLKHHRERLEQYVSLIRGRELSAQQLMRLIYPKVKGYEIFLAISEVMAHLDNLFASGKLNKNEQNGVAYYSLIN